MTNPYVTPASQVLGELELPTRRTEMFYFFALVAGFVVWLFPSLVFQPASWFWEVATGTNDLFESRALFTWVIALLVPALISVGRAIYLLVKRAQVTIARVVFYVLTLLLAIYAAYAWMRPLTAIEFSLW